MPLKPKAFPKAVWANVPRDIRVPLVNRLRDIDASKGGNSFYRCLDAAVAHFGGPAVPSRQEYLKQCHAFGWGWAETTRTVAAFQKWLRTPI